MSKIIYNKILAKLERLDEYLKYLSEIRKIKKENFLTDYHVYGLAERYIQLSIEIMIDVGKLIIVSEKFRKPEDNPGILIIMCENQIISEKMLQDLAGIVNFRNILVHDYEKIDREIVYKKLRNNLNNFVDFKKAILIFIKKKT